jgi:hypothetical protein
MLSADHDPRPRGVVLRNSEPIGRHRTYVRILVKDEQVPDRSERDSCFHVGAVISVGAHDTLESVPTREHAASRRRVLHRGQAGVLVSRRACATVAATRSSPESREYRRLSRGSRSDRVLQILVAAAGAREIETATCSGAYAGAVPKPKEVAVAVVAVFQGPSLTQQQYEETIRRLTDGKSRMESHADWPVDGLMVHVAGQGETGFRVVDVWESEEAFRRFGETLMPILQELGIEVQPEIYPAHTVVSD